MSLTSVLTPAQEHVLALIAAGSTATAAAAAAGVHRNTVGNWMHLAHFRHALAEAHYHQALYWREQAESLASDALDAIRDILTLGKAPAAVRLKAAIMILDRAAAPLPAYPEPVPAAELQPGEAQEPESMHKSAQFSPADPQPALPSSLAEPGKPESVHKNAQFSPRETQLPLPASPDSGSGLRRNGALPHANGNKFTQAAVHLPNPGAGGPRQSESVHKNAQFSPGEAELALGARTGSPSPTEPRGSL